MSIALNRVHLGDYLDFIDQLQDEQFDLAILDPPYNIKADSWDQIPNYLDWLKRVLLKTQKKINKKGALYLWGTTKNNDFLKIKIFMDEFDEFEMEFRNWVVWIKEMKIHKKSDTRLSTKHEDLLFYAYSDHRINVVRDLPTETQLKIHAGRYDSQFFIESSKLPPSQQKQFKTGLQLGSPVKSWWKGPSNVSISKESDLKGFMGYKSVWVCERIIKLSSNETDSVLVPFAGTGTECLACLNTNRNFVAFEIDENRCNIAQKRINIQDRLLPQ